MTEPIRILHCVGRMGRGGAETLIMNIYRNIDRKKVQFDFVVHTNKKCEYDDEIYALGGRIFNVPRYNGKNHFMYKEIWKQLFLKHANEWKIIHGHITNTAVIYFEIAKKFGLLTISHSHNTSSGRGIVAILKNILQYPLKYRSDYLFACSEAAGLWLYGKKYCKKDNFYVLNNAIDVNKFAFNNNTRLKERNELKVKNNFVIGNVGRFNEQKNHDFLIDIFKEIYKKNSKALLLLVGDGNLRPVIENKIDKLGLSEKVVLTGVRSDIPEILQAMDVFVLPSFYEGLPVTLVEAQASGLNCIISNTITDEIKITDSIQFVSLNRSPEYWAEQVLKYSDGYERKNNYYKICAAGYDISENAKWLENFYLKIFYL